MRNTEIISLLLDKKDLFDSSSNCIEAVNLAIKLLESEDLQRTINEIVYESASDEDKSWKLAALKDLIKINFLDINNFTKEWWINKCSMDWGK